MMIGDDKNLEELIDRAGREEVFSLVEKAGWRRWDMPPRYVWQDAAWLILKAKGLVPS
jgi:hypothetical protein